MINIIDFIKKHEGVRYCAYVDSVGVWTTGVGMNLERPDARDRLQRAGINPDVICAAIEEAKKAGRKRTGELLNDRLVNALLEQDLQECYVGLRKMFSDFDKMPNDVQAVLVDLYFNLGQTRLSGFTNTIKAFKDHDWKKAADGLEKSKWFSQVGVRGVENVAILRSIPKT